jgi:hypothetical protein
VLTFVPGNAAANASINLSDPAAQADAETSVAKHRLSFCKSRVLDIADHRDHRRRFDVAEFCSAALAVDANREIDMHLLNRTWPFSGKRRRMELTALVKPNPFGGLGNQLKPLVSALRFTNNIYATTNLFNMIFKRKFPVVDALKEEHRIFSDWRLELKDSDPIGHNFGTVYLNCCSEAEQSRQLRSIDFEYFRIPEILRTEIAQKFRSLELSDVVNTRVFEFTKNWQNNVLGVHVRSWADEPQRHTELYKIEYVFRELDRRRSSMQIFLATDSTDVISVFKERYRKRVLCHPCGPPLSNHENQTEKEIVRAFCDMICLSKAEILLGTYLSTFTECAWWFGNCRQHVVVI